MAKYVTLVELCAEGFASTPSEMWAAALDRGLPLGFDGGGQVGLRVSAADKLRQERHEQRELEARAAELRRQEQQDAEVARLVQQEHAAQTRAREQRLVKRTGASLAEIEREMRLEPLSRPGAGFTLADRDAVYNRPISLADMEAWVADRFGVDVLAS